MTNTDLMDDLAYQIHEYLLEEATPWAPELFNWFKENLYTKKVMSP